MPGCLNLESPHVNINAFAASIVNVCLLFVRWRMCGYLLESIHLEDREDGDRVTLHESEDHTKVFRPSRISISESCRLVDFIVLLAMQNHLQCLLLLSEYK